MPGRVLGSTRGFCPGSRRLSAGCTAVWVLGASPLPGDWLGVASELRALSYRNGDKVHGSSLQTTAVGSPSSGGYTLGCVPGPVGDNCTVALEMARRSWKGAPSQPVPHGAPESHSVGHRGKVAVPSVAPQGCSF